MAEGQNSDFTQITEAPGLQASREQLARLYQRYRFAKDFALGKDVLEVACGSGIGTGYLATDARSMTAGDIDPNNLALAHKNLDGAENVEIRLLDAHTLEMGSESMDLVVMFEAIYYLAAPEKFVAESARVLRSGGTLVLCTVNREWADFHPSPYTHKYFSVPELNDLLRSRFDSVAFFGGFPALNSGLRDKAVSFLKRAAVRLDLIPGNLKARAYLKRAFMGKLAPLPSQLYENITSYEAPVPIPSARGNDVYKIIYAVAKK